MAAIEIMENLFFVERGHLSGNHFISLSEEPALIDTAYISDFEETAGIITCLGVNLSDIRLIINTHCHCDHVGGNKIIQNISDCEIALHRIGKHFMETKDDWSTWWKYLGEEADFFDCTKVLEDEEVIAIGPHEFHVLYTPGHSRDGIVLYSKKEKLLISSDTLWKNDVAAMMVRVEGSRILADMQESLEKLESLDVKIVCPGHGKPFTDVKRAISISKKKIESYLTNREILGVDLLKKVIIHTLLMRKTVEENTFFHHLMRTHWFKENVDLYFNGEYEAKYTEIMNHFIQRGIVKCSNGKLWTILEP